MAFFDFLKRFKPTLDATAPQATEISPLTQKLIPQNIPMTEGQTTVINEAPMADNSSQELKDKGILPDPIKLKVEPIDGQPLIEKTEEELRAMNLPKVEGNLDRPTPPESQNNA